MVGAAGGPSPSPRSVVCGLLVVLFGSLHFAPLYDASDALAPGGPRHSPSVAKSDPDAGPEHGNRLPGFASHAAPAVGRPPHDAPGAGCLGALAESLDPGRAGLAGRHFA